TERFLNGHLFIYISLVAPQRPADPGEGIAIESQTVAPAVVPLNRTFLVSLLLRTLPGEAGIQLRKIWFGQLFFHVLKGEKEHSTVSLSREHVRRHQHHSEGKRREERFPYSLAHYFAKHSHCPSPYRSTLLF